MEVAADPDGDPKAKAIDLVSTAVNRSTATASKRKHLGEQNLRFFSLRKRKDGAEVIYNHDIEDGEELTFSLDEKISPASASDWNGTILTQLGIDFVDCTFNQLFFPYPFTPSERSRTLIQELVQIPNSSTLLVKSYDTLGKSPEDIDTMRKQHQTSLSDSIFKALYLLHKYPNQEPMVDNFVYNLLYRMGFNDGFICVVPQLSMSLKFGNAADKSYMRVAKADFVIQDILSFYKMCVIEDKSKAEERTDSEAQMIAEAIANFQQNDIIVGGDTVETALEVANTSTDETLDELLGVRVNGCRFWFYNIPITKSIVTAMKNMRSVPDPIVTSVKKFGGPSGLDFTDPEHRGMIIEILDKMKQIVQEEGAKSKRRRSGT